MLANFVNRMTVQSKLPCCLKLDLSGFAHPLRGVQYLQRDKTSLLVIVQNDSGSALVALFE